MAVTSRTDAPVMTSTGLPMHLFDADTYGEMVDAGWFEGAHVELLDGILVAISPQSAEHALVVKRLLTHLIRAGCDTRSQAPLAVAQDSVPEPDVFVTDEPDSSSHHPRSARLVIEVSDSSIRLDRGRKQEIYAVAEIPFYWLVDLPRRTVEVRSDPAEAGYRTLTTYTETQTIPSSLNGVPPLSVAERFDGF